MEKLYFYAFPHIHFSKSLIGLKFSPSIHPFVYAATCSSYHLFDHIPFKYSLSHLSIHLFIQAYSVIIPNSALMKQFMQKSRLHIFQ